MLKKVFKIFGISLLSIISIIFLINLYVLSFSKEGYFKNVKISKEVEVGLVLGAGIKSNGSPSDILKDRLIIAIKSYEEGKIKRIIVSGDNRKKNYNEPLSMQKFLIKSGVNIEDIYLDYAGFDTYDSIYRAKEIFGIKSLIIFTQDFHLKRAMYISKRLGIKTYGIETNLHIYRNRIRNSIRELLARVKAFLDIEIFKSKPKFLGKKIEIVSDKRIKDVKESILEDKKITKKKYKNFNLLFNEIVERPYLKNKYFFVNNSIKEKFLKEEYEKKIRSMDLFSDNSLKKFVNNTISFSDIFYIPENLVSVKGNHIIDSKGNIKIKKITKVNLQKMANAFFKDTKNNIVVVSGYRSYLYQKGIKDRGCPDNLCAKAGYSEHQSGLAIDLYSASSNRNWANDNNLQKYYKWLSANAHKYGFTNTYQKGLEIDGYEIEPWHWRYVGIDLATYLKEKEITFAEFYNERNK